MCVALLVVGLFASVPTVSWGEPGDVAHSFTLAYEALPHQANPAVASAPDGTLVVAWEAFGADGSRDIRAAVVGADTVIRSQFQVNATAPGDQAAPAVAVGAAGDFVVVWHGPVAGQGRELFGQRFSAAGTALGPEILIASRTAADTRPDVAVDAIGNAVVTWGAALGNNVRIVARRFAANGEPLGPAFTVSEPSDSAGDASVARGAHGDFVVVWGQQSTMGVYARRFAPDGSAVSGRFRVDADSGVAGEPAAAMDADGAFVVAWTVQSPGVAGGRVHARQYSASGDPRGDAFRVGDDEDQRAPDAAADVSGDFVITWATAGSFRAQLFGADGQARGAAARTVGSAWSRPAAAMDADGDTWVASHGEGTNSVRVHRLSGPQSVDVAMVLSDEVDPTPHGSPFTFVATVTNNHEVSSVTGVPQIDSAIGIADQLYGVIGAYAHLLSVADHGGAACDDQAGSVSCYIRALPAGASVAIRVTGSPSREVMSLSANAFVSGGHQHDPNTDNNQDGEQTALECPPGTSGTIAVSKTQHAVSEGKSVTIHVERIGGDCGPVAVTYALAGTATLGADYTAWTYEPGVIRWGPAVTSRQEIIIHAIADGLHEIEAHETVEVSLQGVPGQGEVGSPSRAVVTVTDGDPEPTLWASGQVVDEGLAGGIRLRLSTASEHTISVPFVWTGSATLEADYTSLATSPVIFTPGTTERLIDVNALNDGLDEENLEVVEVTFGPATHVRVAQSKFGIFIRDRDPSPTVALVTPDGSLAEGGTAEVVARLSAVSGRTVTVPVIVEGASTEVTLSPREFVFLPGATVATIEVRATQDEIDEYDTPVTLRLGPSNAATLGADIESTVLILDDDAPPLVSFTAARGEIMEESNPRLVEIRLSTPSGKPVSVELIHVGGSADYPADYTWESTVVTIPPGTIQGRPMVQVIDDALMELDEEARVALVPVNADLGAIPEFTLVILDEDLPAAHNLRQVRKTVESLIDP